MSRELFDAISRGDVTAVAEAIAGGADLDATEPRMGWGPLHEAIEAIDSEAAPIELLELLLSHGAKVNAWDNDNEVTPLLMAALRSQRECVRTLLAHGADPNVHGGEGDTPLGCAVVDEDMEMLELLLAYGAAASIEEAGTGIEGCTPLGAAAKRGRLDMVERLLAAGADPRATDIDRFTAEDCANMMLKDATDELTIRRLEAVIARLRVAIAK